jgi:hypothetical protein
MKPHKGWRIYFFVVVALMMASLLMELFGQDEYRLALDTVDYLISVIGIVGLFGYAFSRKYFSQGFWKAYVLIGVVWEIFIVAHDFEIDPEFGGLWLPVLTSVFYVLLFGPVYVAVWRYGFRREGL